MPVITLPDGNTKSFDQPVTVQEVAASIAKSLAKAAIAGKLNDRLVDTCHLIEQDARLAIVTEKDEEGVEIIRHSTAHLLAHAVKQLFPEAQVTIGPVIEDGFFYDFSYPPGFSETDLSNIEKQMQKLAKAAYPVSRRVVERQDAINLFREMGEEYKAKIIEDIPEEDQLTLYEQDTFIDLCRGPHVPSTRFLKAFKLTKLAGAYWRGNSDNEMLQRVYGTAWGDKQALEAYLHRLEEAEKRDHRKIAKKMHLFHMQEAAPGMVFWHESGWTLFRLVEHYIREMQEKYHYREVKTPQLVDLELWKQSGHWSKFGDEMFVTESESRTYAIKPMNCPCHLQIFNQGLVSYRDLPVRLAEFGSCHRNEPSGALHGLMRVRSFTQDDGHIICTEEQIADESKQFIVQLQQIYADFGFSELLVKLSTRPEKRVGNDEIWDKAENALEKVLMESGVDWELQPGEGAFYGPKIEFALKDCLGRVWQCGTLQLDFAMPERLGAHYVAEDNTRKTPVMLHRAVLGSLERFIGILIEEYAGNFPLWLAPIQVVVLNITDRQEAYCKKLAEILKKRALRVNLDLRNEKIGFKIREHTIKRVPYIIVVGDKEVAQETITVRTQGGKDLGALSVVEFAEQLTQEVQQRVRAGGNEH